MKIGGNRLKKGKYISDRKKIIILNDMVEKF